MNIYIYNYKYINIYKTNEISRSWKIYLTPWAPFTWTSLQTLGDHHQPLN